MTWELTASTSQTLSLNNSTVYGGNNSDATSADGADTIHISGTASASYAHGNGGNDTIYVGGTALSSSVYGGQGTDDISITGSITNTVVSGNLGNDTMDLESVAKNSTVYGGGGFLYDTSLDGADSIEIGGSLTGSLLHGNGGNDSFYIVNESYESTVYGGQGADLISLSGTNKSITKSWIAGNRGDDKLTLASKSTILNSTILGSDTTGTIAGNDSLNLSARTIQTSTVYGGAGNDTILFGQTSTNTQIVEADIRAFGGADSILQLVRSLARQFVLAPVTTPSTSTPLLVPLLNPPLHRSTVERCRTDLVTSAAIGVAIYGDASATDTAGGADSLSLHAVTSSTVYGAAGADTIKLGGTAKNNYIDAGTGVVDFDAGAVTSSTIIGAASNDSFDFTGAVGPLRLLVVRVLTTSHLTAELSQPPQLLLVPPTTPSSSLRSPVLLHSLLVAATTPSMSLLWKLHHLGWCWC